jgi:hypothetical protein
MSKNNSYDGYIKLLFSKERLKRKMKYFTELCFPSITQQKSSKWKWFLFISPQLPEEYIIQLEKLIQPFKDQIFLHFVSNITDFHNLLIILLKNETEPYITSRIDDDDGISFDFVSEVLQYLPLEDHIINFVNGRITYLQKDTIQFGKEIQYYNNSVGLSAVNKNIFSYGNHVKIHRKNNIIYNTKKLMFFLTHDENYCDTKRKLKIEKF